MIAIVDYGMGNLKSVSKALEAAGARVKVTGNPKDIASADGLVLPGVGAFHRAMENLSKGAMLSPLIDAIREGKPFLGICLGLQLLFTKSEEHGLHKGFDILKGKVRRLPITLKTPHMGWNQIKINLPSPEGFGGLSAETLVKADKIKNEKLKIFEDIPNGSYFYFVHTYYVEPEDKNIVIATTEYGCSFTSVVNKDNVWGVQFHPEKSSKLGLKILENFLSLC